MTSIENNNNTATKNEILVGKNTNELIIKLLFPPTSSLASKFMYVQQHQKVFDVICYATQLSGLQPGYSLYMPASNSTGRGQWLDDDSLLVSYPITSGVEIYIKKKPGSMKRRNTMMTIKSQKEGKVQKLSSITKIWTPRYLRLYSQRLVHSSKENDQNTDSISFADITNVDRHSRLYTFIIYCNNNNNSTTSVNNSSNKENNGSSNHGTLTHSQTKLNLLSTSLNPNSFSESRKEKEYIFRCINQSEMEDWISSIRSMLRKSRPDLLLPPLSVNIYPSQKLQNLSPPTSNPTSPLSSSPLSLSSNTNITSKSAPVTPNKNFNNYNNNDTEDNPLSESLTTTTLPVPTPTKTRSFSFSLGGSRDKKKKDQQAVTPMKLPAPIPQLTLSEKNEQLEEEIRKLRDSLNSEAKRKEELDKKYQKIKTKMAALKKSRARATSTPATPEPSRRHSFIPSFIIGSSRSNSNNNNSNSNNNSNNNSSKDSSKGDNNLVSHKRHSSANSQTFSSSVLLQHQLLLQQQGYKDEDTENDMTSSEVFTNSIFDDLNEEDSEREKEIKELKDQLQKLKDKINIEVSERTKIDSSNRQLEKELFTQKKLDERKEREIIAINQKQEDHFDSLAELTSRLKKSLFELKDKLEKEIKQEQQQQEEEEEFNDDDEDQAIEDDDDEFYQDNDISQIDENQKEKDNEELNNSDNRNIIRKHYRNNGKDDEILNFEDNDDDDDFEVDYSDDKLNRVLDDDTESEINQSLNTTTASIKEDTNYQDILNI
ncbi:hypothetical protein DICPUDRAFT_94279 [Dictyostelium purpureum]|uniref:PH domain-containing protein n=1 Tax=Dictyostelium purpureum TaxID=5786 RepID=F0ZHI9_DICPU|nr:uncharacterized protein DICPUDRAFT_94279 [Dictyostelium purpureum]EGC36576.1 hypothetical protein DICPUDRAFT_94279 [Dictyostelium purpureum]|eukprot:XP_003286880.1 hypothetical protein DICPUDRAFT_94279 [Dictyostelium purpureum]